MSTDYLNKKILLGHWLTGNVLDRLLWFKRTFLCHVGIYHKAASTEKSRKCQSTRSHGEEGPEYKRISQPEPGSKAALRNWEAVMVSFYSRGRLLMGLSYSPSSLLLCFCPPFCQLQLTFSLLFCILFSASWRASSYVCVLSCSTLCNPWTVVHQVPLSMGISRQEYWSGLPFPPPGDLPDPGIKPLSPVSPALTDGFFTTEPRGAPAFSEQWALLAPVVPHHHSPSSFTSHC